MFSTKPLFYFIIAMNYVCKFLFSVLVFDYIQDNGLAEDKGFSECSLFEHLNCLDRWVLSQTKKEDTDEDIAKYDGKS